MTLVTTQVLAELAEERRQQDKKFPDQRLPDGTHPLWKQEADRARNACNLAAQGGYLTWRHILEEETSEALAEVDEAKLRAELVQVAAVAVRWIEDIDARAT